MNLQQIRYRLENLRGQRDRLDTDIRAGETRIAALKEDAVNAEEARAIIQTVAQQTQQQLEYHISEITSLALAAVFDNPYTLHLVFVQRRNKTEADILLERDGQQFRPIDASGGGVVDIAAFALRVAMWSLGRPRSRNTLILDEPFRMLSRDRMSRAAAMLAEISKRLGLQMILVSHSQELIEDADRYFTVSMHKGVSHVEQGNGSGDSKDIGNQGTEQSTLDGDRSPGLQARTAGGSANNGKDSQGRRRDQQADGQTRRRRT